jgi:CubicO group peptidase (beta-lactamase class C family)
MRHVALPSVGLLVRALITSIVTLILVISVSRLQPARAVKQGTSLETLTGQLDERIPSLMRAYDIPGASIALVRGGKTVWTKAYGYADLETGRRMTTDTYLRVQSISKPVTAWGVMKLVEQGEIDLDCPVEQYLKDWRFPESRYAVGQITVRQLLSHRAGLPLGDIFNRYAPTEVLPSLQESLTKEAVLMRDPGTAFFYSNTGYNLLELLIEEVTGRDFTEYMEHEILRPLGMQHATFSWSEALEPPVPFGYDLNGRAVPVYVYPEKGSGGLFATVGDIATFVAAGMPDFSQDHPVLSPESILALYAPAAKELGIYSLVFDAYGLGHYVEELANGHVAVSHGGQGTGWMTHFHSVPEKGDGIVILTNSQRSWPFIAHLLSDWAHWNGFSPPGMGRIVWGEYALWGLIGLLCSFVLWQAWRLGEGVVVGTRHLAPLAPESRLVRVGQGGLSAVLFAGLAWCASQEYLFISSVFPIASVWLGVVGLALAVVLLLSALLP